MPKKTNKRRSDGRLKSKVYLGDGKYKYVYASNAKELAEKVQEVKMKLGKGLDLSLERETFKFWADRWLSLKKISISDGRYKSYGYRIDKMEDIHKKPITKITVADIQAIINDAAGDGASEKTLKEYKSVFSQVCDYAIINRVMDFNPAKGIILPKTAPKEERRALTNEEQAWITAPTQNRARLGALIMMYAGLRRGELLALTWPDIDLKNRTITINKSVEMIDGKPHIKPSTKTKAGMRVINIPRMLADYLTEEKTKAATLLVMPNTDGQLMSGNNWRHMWDSYMNELNFRFGDFTGIMVKDKDGNLQPYKKKNSRFAKGKVPMVIPPFTAHWLRHTYITMLYMAGVDVITASKQAGHSDIQTTMDIYTHLDDKFKRTQMDKFDEYLGKTAK